MASSGGALNLSLLSRGVGEISKNGHEKIDVVFEPQDYFNFSGNTSRIFLPPITPKYDFDATSSTASKFKIIHEIPKTFTTRKGALLLYSEDQAHRSTEQTTFRKGHGKHHTTEEVLELTKSEDDISLRTVDDLAKSILSFGKRETAEEPDVYLGFVHNYGRRKKDLFERQIRPGFSAKRYLSLWTKSWDDNVLGKVISKGYLTEKSLFYYNPLNPHLQRRLNDDMSHYPAPYKLMRSMLMSPGSLSGYTFYRVRPESADTIVTPEHIDRGQTPSQKGSIKVISTKDGVQKEVSYSALDKDAQEEVLTDLLVKSAVHYAMKKQQEYIDESHREKAIPEVDESRRSSVQQFDMKDAVESLLDSQRGKGAINTDFPEDKSEVSSRSGSIKGKTLKRSRGSKDKATSPLPNEQSDGEKEYVGNVPVASVRGEQSSIPQLPHISGHMPLTPIGEASREGTRMTIPVSLPPIGQEQGIDGIPAFTVLPPTPQHSNLTASPTKMVVESRLREHDDLSEESDESGVGLKTERTEQTEKSDRRYVSEDTERRKRKQKRLGAESSGLALSGGYHLQSSTESLTQTSSHSLPAAKPIRTHWKGSTQSLKSDRSKKGYHMRSKREKKFTLNSDSDEDLDKLEELPELETLISESYKTDGLSGCLTSLPIMKSKQKSNSSEDVDGRFNTAIIEKVSDDNKMELPLNYKEAKQELEGQKDKIRDSNVTANIEEDQVEEEALENTRSFVDISKEKHEIIQLLPLVPNYLLDRRSRLMRMKFDRKRNMAMMEQNSKNVKQSQVKKSEVSDEEYLRELEELSKELLLNSDQYKEFERRPDKKKKSVSFADFNDARKTNIPVPKKLNNEKFKTSKTTSSNEKSRSIDEKSKSSKSISMDKTNENIDTSEMIIPDTDNDLDAGKKQLKTEFQLPTLNLSSVNDLAIKALRQRPFSVRLPNETDDENISRTKTKTDGKPKKKDVENLNFVKIRNYMGDFLPSIQEFDEESELYDLNHVNSPDDFVMGEKSVTMKHYELKMKDIEASQNLVFKQPEMKNLGRAKDSITTKSMLNSSYLLLDSPFDENEDILSPIIENREKLNSGLPENILQKGDKFVLGQPVMFENDNPEISESSFTKQMETRLSDHSLESSDNESEGEEMMDYLGMGDNSDTKQQVTGLGDHSLDNSDVESVEEKIDDLGMGDNSVTKQPVTELGDQLLNILDDENEENFSLVTEDRETEKLLAISKQYEINTLNTPSPTRIQEEDVIIQHNSVTETVKKSNQFEKVANYSYLKSNYRKANHQKVDLESKFEIDAAKQTNEYEIQESDVRHVKRPFYKKRNLQPSHSLDLGVLGKKDQRNITKRIPTGSLEDGSNKGSIVIGPDGEPISVGGHIEAHTRPDHQHIENVGDANRYFGRDLVSDQESDDEPDVWKRRRGVQREDMRNYAHKRERGPGQQRQLQRRSHVPRQTSFKSKSNSLSTANKSVRFSASSKDKDEGFEEIDYTAGDIDATLSINSWSYMPRDSDPEFAGIVDQVHASSLPGIPFRSDGNSKEFTQILSRATEKTEEAYFEEAPSPDKSAHISIPPVPPGTGQTAQESHVRLTSRTSQQDDKEAEFEASMLTEDDQGRVSKSSRQDNEEVFDADVSDLKSRSRSLSKNSSRLSKRKSMSQLEMRSASKVSLKSQEGRRSSMTDAERQMSNLSRRDSRLSKISLQHSISRTSSHHDAHQDSPVVETLKEVEKEQDSASSRGVESPVQEKPGTPSIEKQPTPPAIEKQPTPPVDKESTPPISDKEDSDKRSDNKMPSPIGTVAPSRPGSPIVVSIPTGSEPASPTNDQLPTPPKEVPSPTKTPAESGAPPDQVERGGSGQSAQSQISEKDIIDVLENTARQIAASTLSRSDSGQDIEKDARQAAELWLEKNAPRIISRSQSVQDVQGGDSAAIKAAVENGRKSAGPSAGEYKELIKEKLQTALSNTEGESIPNIPDDAELSPELLEALKNNSITPDDIEVVRDEETGKNIVRSKSQLSAAMGGVKEGHIYVPVAKNGAKAPGSIPTDRQSTADIGEFGVINYGKASSSDAGSKVGSARTARSSKVSEKLSDKASEKMSDKGSKSQPPSVVGESIVEEEEDRKSQRSGRSQMSKSDEEIEEPEDEFKKAVEEVEKVNEMGEADQQGEERVKSERGSVVSKKSEKSAVSDDKKSKVSDKTEKSDLEKKKNGKPTEKKEEFVVGKVKEKNENEALYGPPSPPPKGATPPGEDEKPTSKSPPKPANDSPQKTVPDKNIKVQPPIDDTKLPPLPQNVPSLDRGQKSKKFENESQPATLPDLGKVSTKGELEKLFGEYGLPPPKPGTKKKGKPKDTKKKPAGKKATDKPAKGKGKAKKEPEPKPAEPEPEPQPPKEPTPPPPPLPVVEDKAASDNESDQESLATTHKSSESDFEFHFVRETPSPTPPPPPKPPSTIPSVEDEPTDEEEKQDDEDDEAARLRMISNREARAAKRAAQAAKRKEEVERKRREKEEQSRREREEQERAEQLKREMEAERRKTLEAKRQKKMEEDMEREREAQEQEEKMARQRAEAEREKRRKEEYQRKLDEMKRKQAEEEQRRYEEQMQRLREEEERRKEEEAKMALMAEEERIEYERIKKIEEEERKRREAEEKKRREEEAQKAMEEARRLAEEMARKQAEMEARLKFNRSLQVEARGLDHSHNITEAFVFSYFELLNWFGLDVPEFELLKLNQY